MFFSCFINKYIFAIFLFKKNQQIHFYMYSKVFSFAFILIVPKRTLHPSCRHLDAALSQEADGTVLRFTRQLNPGVPADVGRLSREDQPEPEPVGLNAPNCSEPSPFSGNG